MRAAITRFVLAILGPIRPRPRTVQDRDLDPWTCQSTWPPKEWQKRTAGSAKASGCPCQINVDHTHMTGPSAASDTTDELAEARRVRDARKDGER